MRSSPTRPERTAFTVAGLTCVCQRALERELRPLYEAGGWAWDALRERPGAELLRGRRPVVAATLADGTAVVVKRLAHGGLLAPMTGDRFLSSTRIVRPLRLADALAAAGIPTPPVLFVAWRRAGLFVRGEIGTLKVSGAVDASQRLFSGTLPEGWREVAVAVGVLVARLHAVGFVHGDLNLMNILVDGGGAVAILDLDKGALRPPPLPAGVVRANLARLERSVRKQGKGAPPTDVEAVLAAVWAGYAGQADA